MTDASTHPWRRFESPAGTVVFYRVEGVSLENVIYGHMEEPVATFLQARFEEVEREHGEFYGFHYWLHAPTYDTAYRSSWMQWLRSRPGTLKETHFLTRSRLVQMGLSVANLAYSNTSFRVYTREGEYLMARAAFMPPVGIPSPQGLSA